MRKEVKIMKNIYKYYISLAAISVLLYSFIIFNSYIQLKTVTGPSMETTIQNESVAISETSTNDIKVNSIYCMRDPESFEDIVKRVVAVPGDTVEIKNNKLYINGVEDTSTFSLDADYSRSEGLKITVPENEYFVLGDNRNVSVDSRYFGTVPKEYIKSKVIWTIY